MVQNLIITIYEYNGSFWHGYPNLYNSEDMNNVVCKTFGELYKKTVKKEKKIKNLGYNYVSIWGNTWIKSINIIRKIQRKWRINKLI